MEDGPDVVDDEDPDVDNEGVELSILDTQDPQGQLDHVENEEESTAPENPDQGDTMDSNGREDNGVQEGVLIYQEENPPTR